MQQLQLCFEKLPLDLHYGYHKYIIAFSGGKDSLACLLHLLSVGVEPSQIELWHHCVDGFTAPGVDEERPLMDWSCTVAYVKAVGKAFGVPVYLSWKQGGFEKEMLRQDQDTAPVFFETPDGLMKAGGNSGKLGTRMKFPQTSADLNVRWCSAYLKIAVCEMAFRNQKRFENINTLFISGERAQESAARAKYLPIEIHRADPRKTRKGKGKVDRHVDHWRPVLHWTEQEVWDIIKRFRVNPHPAYRLGWSRLSCMTCIFGSKRMFASAHAIAPHRTVKLDNYENLFGVNIKRTGGSVLEQIEGVEPFKMNAVDVNAALSTEWHEPIILPAGQWKLPAGAFGENAGPS